MLPLRRQSRPAVARRRPIALSLCAVAGLVAFGLQPMPAAAAPSVVVDEATQVVLSPGSDTATEQGIAFRLPNSIDGDVAVELRPEGGEARTVETEEYDRSLDGVVLQNHYHVHATDLEPSTTYEYRIVSTEDDESALHLDWTQFTTAAQGAAPTEFLYFGDAQADLEPGGPWRTSIDAAWERFPDPDLALHAGDLIDVATAENEWADWFSGVDVAAKRINQAPAPGNHELVFDLDMSRYLSAFSTPDNGADGSPGSYYFDHHDVRFVTVDGNEPDLHTEWIDEVLGDHDQKWTVVQVHQPVYSGRTARSSDTRDAIIDAIQEHDVDLVLQGHDHTYARGYDGADATDTEGMTTGPVYVLSTAGAKYYEQAPEDDNEWTENGAVQVKRAGETSTYQNISIDGCRLEYSSYVGYKGGASTTDVEVGGLFDSFSIDKCTGEKFVFEPGVEVPQDEETEAPEDDETEEPTPTPTDEPTSTPTATSTDEPTSTPTDGDVDAAAGGDDDASGDAVAGDDDDPRPGEDAEDGDETASGDASGAGGGSTGSGDDSGSGEASESGDGSTLPRTGANTWLPVAAGGALVALGGGLLAAGRRKSTRPTARH